LIDFQVFAKGITLGCKKWGVDIRVSCGYFQGFPQATKMIGIRLELPDCCGISNYFCKLPVF
jgi:hypothetical protein